MLLLLLPQRPCPQRPCPLLHQSKVTAQLQHPPLPLLLPAPQQPMLPQQQLLLLPLLLPHPLLLRSLTRSPYPSHPLLLQHLLLQLPPSLHVLLVLLLHPCKLSCQPLTAPSHCCCPLLRSLLPLHELQRHAI